MKRISLITLVAFAACSDDPKPADADATTATEETSVETDTLEPETTDEDVEVVEEVEPDTIEEVEPDTVEDVDTGEGIETTEPGEFVLGTADLADEFVFKGVWAGEAGRIVAVGNDGVVATRDPAGAWKTLARVEGASLLNAIHGVDGQHLWAVGVGGAILPGTIDSFGESDECEGDGDCNDSDTCTIDRCVENVCQAESTGAAGCCGATVMQYTFDNGTLEGWALPAADKLGPWQWASVAIPGRATSGTNSMYFGNAAAVPPTYDAGTDTQVRGTALSPLFRLPLTGTATLKFNVFLDAEPDVAFDNLWIEVVSGAERVEIWSKADLGGVPTFSFVEAEADLSAYRGKQIALRVNFDSSDGTFNTFEGPYLDDIRVETACTTGGAASGTSGPTLWGVFATGINSGFAVGRDGTILTYNGTDWRPAQGADPSAVWQGISGAGEDKIALVGTGGIGIASFGSGLQTVTTGSTRNLLAVHTNDGNEWWGVGDAGTLVHGTGTTWTVDASLGITGKMLDVHGVSNDNVWAVGDKGVVAHWDGDGWTLVATDTVINLLGVWVDDNGDPNIIGKNGILLRRTDAGIVTVETLYPGGDLNDIWGSGDGSFYTVVGTSGHAMVYRNGAWEETESNTGQILESVYGTSATDVWAVGRAGTALHWDGTAWTRAETPSTAALNAVWGSAADKYYAVGSGGTLLVFTGSWQAITTPSLTNLRAVHGRTPNDVWAVGANASIIHYGGLGWGKSPVAGIPNAEGGEDPITEELHAVWAAAPNDAWAVGAAGRILHWDGTLWNIVETDFTTTLRGVYGLASNDVWAVGNEGTILHFNGAEWERIETGSIATLHAIHGDGAGHVVVVGDIGTVLYLQR